MRESNENEEKVKRKVEPLWPKRPARRITNLTAALNGVRPYQAQRVPSRDPTKESLAPELPRLAWMGMNVSRTRDRMFLEMGEN